MFDTMPGKSKARQALEADIISQRNTHNALWHTAFPARAAQFAMLGATNEEIAAFLGVSPPRFEQWIVEKPALARALANGRELADVRVARAAYRRATGFTRNAQKVMNIGGEAQRVDYKEYFPPDVAAIKFWLTNKRPGQWQDRSGSSPSTTVNLLALVEQSLGRTEQVAKEPLTIDASVKETDGQEG